MVYYLLFLLLCFLFGAELRGHNLAYFHTFNNGITTIIPSILRGTFGSTIEMFAAITKNINPNASKGKKNKANRAPFKRISLGICAMDKKARSKPMREILSRFPEDKFEITIFGDHAILEEPIESWPVVECLIAFQSTRYPTDKVLRYVELRKPFMINDLVSDDEILKDRRKVAMRIHPSPLHNLIGTVSIAFGIWLGLSPVTRERHQRANTRIP